jgi:hypothetical protein
MEHQRAVLLLQPLDELERGVSGKDSFDHGNGLSNSRSPAAAGAVPIIASL